MAPTTASIGAPGLVDFEPGQVLFQQDDLAQRVYVIRSGFVRLTRRVFREEFIVEELGKGNVCGDVAFAENVRYPVTATAIDHVKALSVAREDLDKALLADPNVVAMMARKMAARLAHAHFRMATFALRSSIARVMIQLRYEAARSGALGGNAYAPLPYDLPHALATEAGVVRSCIEKLVHDGLIELDGAGRFRVVDQRAYDRYLAYLELNDRFDAT